MKKFSFFYLIFSKIHQTKSFTHIIHSSFKKQFYNIHQHYDYYDYYDYYDNNDCNDNNDINLITDILTSEIVYFPNKKINFDIYDQNITLEDPDGNQIIGLSKYKNLLSSFRIFCNSILGTTTTKYHLEKNENSIKITWHIIFSISSKNIYLDGISYYYLNNYGLINSHKIDTFLFRDNSLKGINHFNIFDLSKVLSNEPIFAFQFEKCNYIWDCEYPQDCCDFLITKICFNKNFDDSRKNKPRHIPIPIPIPNSIEA